MWSNLLPLYMTAKPLVTLLTSHNCQVSTTICFAAILPCQVIKSTIAILIVTIIVTIIITMTNNMNNININSRNI